MLCASDETGGYRFTAADSRVRYIEKTIRNSPVPVTVTV